MMYPNFEGPNENTYHKSGTADDDDEGEDVGPNDDDCDDDETRVDPPNLLDIPNPNPNPNPRDPLDPPDPPSPPDPPRTLRDPPHPTHPAHPHTPTGAHRDPLVSAKTRWEPWTHWIHRTCQTRQTRMTHRTHQSSILVLHCTGICEGVTLHNCCLPEINQEVHAGINSDYVITRPSPRN